MVKNKKNHWEEIYRNKQPNVFSWTQKVPKISLKTIKKLNLPKNAKIIDIGGGDSTLTDFLIKDGFHNITVLDISSKAIERMQERLKDKSKHVRFIVSDILEFESDEGFDLWHDRATFHFLITKDEINYYLKLLKQMALKHLILSTFSDEGPKKCSGLPVRNYSEGKLKKLLFDNFRKDSCKTYDHITPFYTKQNFLFCNFIRK